MGRPGGMKGGLPPFGTTSSSQAIIRCYNYYTYSIGVIVNASSNRNRLASLAGIGCYTITTCYKITLPSYTIVTCNLIIKFRHVSEIDDLLRISYLRYRSKFSYPMPV